MQVIYIIIALVLSYLFGSIPFGLILGKLVRGIDIREHGSGSVGTTNVARTLGLKWALINFIFDALKGALPIILIAYVFRLSNLYLINNINIITIYGAVAALGHIFSIYIKFKGGKAIATGVGAVIAISPVVGVAGILIYLLILAITKYSSLGSIIAATLVGVGVYLDVFIWQIWLTGGPRVQVVNLVIMALLVCLIIFKHRSNIIRLLNGTEPKFGKKNKNKLKEETTNFE